MEGTPNIQNNVDATELGLSSQINLVNKEIQVYKRRWLMLCLFVMYSMSNAFQWIQYSIIENIITKYYGVSPTWVEWTSMIYMISYMILIVPGSWALDKYGLKKCVVAGALGTCLGAWIKVFSTTQSGFPVTFAGQTVVAISQVFVLSVPARLAAVWFGTNEVSSACSIGVFGNQFGIAAGFLLPPMIVKDQGNMATMGFQLGIMFKGVAAFTSVLLALILFFFEEQPPVPPSQAALKQAEEVSDFAGSLKRLMTNYGYVLLLVSYGINVGVFYAISTLLNKLILAHFPDGGEDAGRIGLSIVLAGTVGSVVCGVSLDKTHKFKEITLIVYSLSLIGMTGFALLLDCGHIIVLYIMAGALGFFMTGYLPVGFEFAAELTYPEPQGTSVGLLNGICQVFGVLFTMGYSWLIESQGTVWGSMYLDSTLAVGVIMTLIIPKDYRRYRASTEKSPA
uniref:Choline/ethanolamine transporter FLVCR1 n=1 Tax=Lygus hesperus TaxID=30085 RepID=A0A0A9XGN9_LYGHE